VTKKDLKK